VAVRKDIHYVQNMSVRHSNGELIGVILENVNGPLISVVFCYRPTSWILKSHQTIESALTALAHPIIVCGDFNTHRQS
jgi:endonuclease/exonuclease/phosphatase family metal-dependent hydrolase